MVVAHGYVHNSPGNIAIRVPPDFEHGIMRTKHAEIALDEKTLDNVVITDVPTPALPAVDVTARREQTERDK
jgi:hypothetical protein